MIVARKGEWETLLPPVGRFWWAMPTLRYLKFLKYN